MIDTLNLMQFCLAELQYLDFTDRLLFAIRPVMK